MQFIWWAVVGVIAGWATGKIMKGSRHGVLMDIALGIAGSFMGGFLTQLTGFASRGGLLYTLGVAICGAVILASIARPLLRFAKA
jgi:uncharacterized membrane protein YeaQ/YmgE (transglycosylase-associated protein family)